MGQTLYMAVVAQLVRVLDCDSRCRGFESRRSPFLSKIPFSIEENSVKLKIWIKKNVYTQKFKDFSS